MNGFSVSCTKTKFENGAKFFFLESLRWSSLNPIRSKINFLCFASNISAALALSLSYYTAQATRCFMKLAQSWKLRSLQICDFFGKNVNIFKMKISSFQQYKLYIINFINYLQNSPAVTNFYRIIWSSIEQHTFKSSPKLWNYFVHFSSQIILL
jgi:hypothetical protein